jgi:hypothetical protein
LILLLVFKVRGDHHKQEWRVANDIRVGIEVDIRVDADSVLAYGARDADTNADTDADADADADVDFSDNGCNDNMDWYRRLLIVVPTNVTPGFTKNWNDSTTDIGNMIIIFNKNNRKTKQILFSYFQSSRVV